MLLQQISINQANVLSENFLYNRIAAILITHVAQSAVSRIISIANMRIGSTSLILYDTNSSDNTKGNSVQPTMMISAPRLDNDFASRRSLRSTSAPTSPALILLTQSSTMTWPFVREEMQTAPTRHLCERRPTKQGVFYTSNPIKL